MYCIEVQGDHLFTIYQLCVEFVDYIHSVHFKKYFRLLSKLYLEVTRKVIHTYTTVESIVF